MANELVKSSMIHLYRRCCTMRLGIDIIVSSTTSVARKRETLTIDLSRTPRRDERICEGPVVITGIRTMQPVPAICFLLVDTHKAIVICERMGVYYVHVVL